MDIRYYDFNKREFVTSDITNLREFYKKQARSYAYNNPSRPEGIRLHIRVDNTGINIRIEYYV